MEDKSLLVTLTCPAKVPVRMEGALSAEADEWIPQYVVSLPCISISFDGCWTNHEALIVCQPQKVSVPSTRGEIPWLHRLSLRYSKVEYLRYELPALERSAQATGKETSQIYGFGPDRHPHVTISGEQWLKEYLFS